ncbi:hypothetical protein JOC86_004061 [Bacillus pakistanensis]|uniref:Rod shape-determining protein MreD n=1 Tax=Rossellomorea pakistanensis TaxID=992288 RepID=A0ABS2NHY7_9BACI|nr:hypothetical protein [Bacillus pakistanensis]MBM7587488.1 hypothetical protein [Bacillus pakistanensis]
MFKIPIDFDENEWFILLVLTSMIVFYIIMPKKLPGTLTLLMMLFYAFLGRIADFILAFDYPFNLYDTMDTSSYDLFDFITYSTVYPLYGFFFANFYYSWNLKGFYRVVYIIVWVLMSLFFEYIAIYFQVFHFNGWNLFYSFIVYVVVFILIVLYLELTIKWYKQETLRGS